MWWYALMEIVFSGAIPKEQTMDRVNNPYSPGAGTPPPELSGRDEILEDARVALARIKAGRSEQGLMLTGLRGVGKTVLL